jgi:hypothetical protein
MRWPCRVTLGAQFQKLAGEMLLERRFGNHGDANDGSLRLAACGVGMSRQRLVALESVDLQRAAVLLELLL